MHHSRYRESSSHFCHHFQASHQKRVVFFCFWLVSFVSTNITPHTYKKDCWVGGFTYYLLLLAIYAAANLCLRFYHYKLLAAIARLPGKNSASHIDVTIVITPQIELLGLLYLSPVSVSKLTLHACFYRSTFPDIFWVYGEISGRSRRFSFFRFGLGWLWVATSRCIKGGPQIIYYHSISCCFEAFGPLKHLIERKGGGEG